MWKETLLQSIDIWRSYFFSRSGYNCIHHHHHQPTNNDGHDHHQHPSNDNKGNNYSLPNDGGDDSHPHTRKLYEFYVFVIVSVWV